jgi:hypothetical protein
MLWIYFTVVGCLTKCVLPLDTSRLLSVLIVLKPVAIIIVIVVVTDMDSHSVTCSNQLVF